MGGIRVAVLLFWGLNFCSSFIAGSVQNQEISEHRSSILYWKRIKRQAYASDVGISVDSSKALPETGPWGPWNPKGECSRTCGGGVIVEERTCGGTCTGHSKRYVSCNQEACADGADFRAQQCEEYNDQPLEGKYYKWKPYSGGNKNKCELNCQPDRESFFYKFKDRVTDGTKCDSISDDICVEGLCLPVGCDGQLGSTAKMDKCLVCNGNGDTCKTVSGFFDERNLEAKAYHDLVTIPEGATKISVKEQRATNNYLAIRNASDYWFLNGNFKIEMSGNKDIAGTLFDYERKRENGLTYEKLGARGPLTQEITIALLYQSESSTGISYEYSVPLDDDVQYIYEPAPWTACSVTCGKGVKTRQALCMDTKSNARVNDVLCDENNASKPVTEMDCETADCDASWFSGAWEECSETCGDRGEQYRVVYCHQIFADGRKITVEDEKCTEAEPEYKQTCNRFSCPDWNAGPWSACSKPCGEAKQYRSVTCRSEKEGDEGKLLASSACDADSMPGSERKCNLGPCEGLKFETTGWELCEKCNDTTETREVSCQDPTGRKYTDDKCEGDRPDDSRDCATPIPCVYKWHASQWSECSTECGHGHQTRTAVCTIEEDGDLRVMDASHCDPNLKPALRQNCTSETTCTGTWMAAQWSECTASCEGGTQTRKVVCFDYDFKLREGMCDEAVMPKEEQECNTHDCPTCGTSDHGCCPDNSTFASGPYLEGCSNCSTSEFGCCSDNYTDASGPDKEGCPDFDPGSGEGQESSADPSECASAEFGCCEDGQMAASGPDNEGCECEYTNEETGDTLTTACVIAKADNGTELAGNLFLNATDGNGTEVNVTKHCSKSEFGCCPDWYTEAEGPNNEVCPDIILGECNGTKFGCCLDEVALSRGENYEGCGEASCVGSLYGCCKDRRTIAFGPHYKGCERSSFPCETSAFGCCPDGETAALGDNGEGCESTCILTKFGCCPDGVTAAEGAKNEGCGCRYARFGCCADGKTDARGPSYAGCPQSCAQSTYGCCPDGTTAAQGPNLEGCPCEFSAYGCCADGLTSARGPNWQGCDNCRYAKFGCCPDGNTVALGPNYKSCPIPKTTVSPLVAGGTVSPIKIAACSLPQLNGIPCSGWSLKYYYDTQQGECRQFWYGGCGGNENRFDSPQDCQTVCISPPGIGVCYLPNMNGQKCSDWKLKYYYDVSNGACRPFYYGGCKGNNNNFEDERSCLVRCRGVTGPGQTVTTTTQPVYNYLTEQECRAPYDSGSCTQFVSQYYFESYSGRCLTFFYGGCAGNSNRFETEYECQRQCGRYGPEPQTHVEPVAPTQPRPQPRPPQRRGGNVSAGPAQSLRPDAEPRPVEIDPCAQRLESGDQACNGQFSHWYYDVAVGNCLEFKYTGCGGNHNRFRSEENCRARCVPQTRRRPAPIPSLRRSTDAVRPLEEDQSQNVVSAPAIDEVNKSMRSQNVQTPPLTTENPCLYVLCDVLPVVDCEETVEEPYNVTYEIQGLTCPCTRLRCVKRRDPCENFVCEQEPVEENCALIEDSVSKAEVEPGVFCDCLAQKCVQKNFDESSCDAEKDTGDLCLDEYERLWYYKAKTGTCGGFYYGGCGGNANRFNSEEECRARCAHRADPCAIPMVVGPCRAYKERYFYDSEKGTCESFSYGGCMGNTNNFQTLEACQERCNVIPSESVEEGGEAMAVVSVSLTETENVDTVAEDPCTQPMAVGRCRGYVESWYFNQLEGKCMPFIYGGCGGSNNRFDTVYDCEEKCGVTLQAIREERKPVLSSLSTEGFNNDVPTEPVSTEGTYDVCSLPQMTGPCTEFAEAWFYDILDERCDRFWYGGCGGNQNRFRSEKECMQVCTGRSIRGGFERPTPAESTVAPTGSDPIDIPYPVARTYAPPTSILPELCELPKEEGDSFGEELQWYFDMELGRCEGMAYTGTKGNANRFSSLEACQRACGEYRDQDVCSMSADEGPCDRTVNRWYYDSSNKTCQLYFYGGCQGNGNRFSSWEECTELCSTEAEKATDVCKLAILKGPCRAAEQRFAFNSETQQCQSFIYGGCRGNENNFATMEDCQARCRGNTESQAEDICQLKYDSGLCEDSVKQYFFDKDYGESGECRPFTWGGCGGNANRFRTKHECEVRCRGKEVAPLTQNPEEVCLLKFDVGPCKAKFIQWYFDPEYGRCEEFVYGGCLGNANNFKTRKECVATCTDIVPRKPQDPFRVVLVSSKRAYREGQTIEFTCRLLLDKAPEKGFVWFKGTSRIDETESQDSRFQIYENGTLIIVNAAPSDTGEYSCAPDIYENSVFSDSLKISVQGPSFQRLIEPVGACVDFPEKADCKGIVGKNLCTMEFYAQFCCRSCQRAGVRLRFRLR